MRASRLAAARSAGGSCGSSGDTGPVTVLTIRESPALSPRGARKHRKAGKAAYLVDMEISGRKPEVAVTVSTEKASPEVAARLDLGRGERVLVRTRRMLADGQPLQLAVSYLPLELVKGTRI